MVRWTHLTLLAAAASMLAYCGFVLADAHIFQAGERRRLERLLTQPRIARAISIAPIEGDLIGRIEIARLGVSAVVVEGVTALSLRRAVGHIPGTALPGQAGNTGISGHRDTFFRPLRNIRRDDIVILTTLLGEYRYRVVSTRIVGPHDVDVLDPGAGQVLTLVTCYPFYFVGSAPDRFIVRAERMGGNT